jgi:hypothetical protein
MAVLPQPQHQRAVVSPIQRVEPLRPAEAPRQRNVTLSDITGKTASFGNIAANATTEVSTITMKSAPGPVN